jgi:hypothetical protein
VKYLNPKTITLGFIAAACITVPLATGTASAASRPSDTVPVTTTPTRTFDLAAAKVKADAAIEQRLGSLSAGQGALKGVTHGDCQASTMSSELASDSAGLSALKSQIDALPSGTTFKQFKALADQITQHYRVYMLEAPKAAIVVGCDKIFNVADRLDSLAGKIQAKLPSADVSALKSHAQAARDYATKAVSTVIDLKADDGNTSVMASNKAAILQARSYLRSAVSELRAGRDAAKAIKG